MPIGFTKPVRGKRPMPVGSAVLTAGRAWLPSDAASATLVAWWDATDAATIATSGGNVTSWASKIASRAASASDSTTTYDAANKRILVNGGAGLVFPDSGLPAGASPGCVAVVARGSQTSNSGFVIGYGSTGTDQFRVVGTSGGSTGGFRNGAGDTITSAITFDQQPLILLDLEYSTSSETRINGGAVTATGTRSVSTTLMGQGSIGRLLPSSSFRPFQGWVSQVVMYSGALSNTDRDKLEGYLAWVSGQQALLPAGHLYKTAAPTVAS